MKLDKYSLFSQGIFIENMTSSQRFLGLVNRLYPVKTKFDLIRIGNENDGGYLLPNDLDGIIACFSPGVDINASFELDLLKSKGINSHLADFSVDGPPMGLQPISFTKKFIGAVNENNFITLDKWIRGTSEFESSEDLMLQMDIEGGEYLSILSASEEVLKRFRIIVIEIHDIEIWGSPKFFEIVEAFFSKLLTHFNVIHNHPNNCCGKVNLGGFLAPRVFELTLLRKDRANIEGYCDIFPHPLDRPNVINRDELHLDKNWYFRKK